MIPHIKAKLFSMKKKEEFYVLPNDLGEIVAESDNYIAKFNKHGFGIFSKKGSWFEAVEFPFEFVNDAMMICPAMGKEKFFDGEVEV